ncbi:hypothetical protein Patl1_37300 [Pistacia atlantica]|nr:hypothetical protein Patl1_37300 [Pistacia atlantica]
MHPHRPFHLKQPHHSLLKIKPQSSLLLPPSLPPNPITQLRLMGGLDIFPLQLSSLSLCFFRSMLRHSTLLCHRTLASLFKTCASLSYAFSFGLSLHSLSLKLSLQNKPFCGSALIKFYSCFRSPDNAKQVFDEIQDTEEFCYSAMIVCFAHNSCCLDSLSVFADMRSSDVGSTAYNVSGALRAVAELAAVQQCGVVHGHAVVAGLDEFYCGNCFD